MDPEVEKLKNALISTSKEVKKNLDMYEGAVYSCFDNSNFFKNLGYRAYGIDIRVQEREKGKAADYECLDDIEQSIFILEVKRPSDDKIHPLISYKDKQLKEKYVLPRRSKYGVLTNGIKFYVFERKDSKLIEIIKVEDLESITTEDAKSIYYCLRKPKYEYTNLKRTLEQIKEIEPKPLTDEENRKLFYEVFKLRQTESGFATKFTRLVYELMSLFDELLRNDKKSEFLDGAYRFWKQAYAHKPSKIPESWRKLQYLMAKLNEEQLYKFMFCLETAHSIVAKLILAKVCEDNELKGVNALEKLKLYMSLEFGDKAINYVAYPFAIKKTFDVLRNSLVESLFEDDIFNWWTDIDMLVGKTHHEWKQKPNLAVENFGRALASIFFTLRTFDFSGMREDLLGELYQQYFDPETRKALGEFYTPIEVVDYILDAVDYKGEKILNQRLLDPACGSGTFIVEALKRYLKEAEKYENSDNIIHASYWCSKLEELCEKPKIIGFDINPFACLMAQIRFMIEIIPYYKKAKEEYPDFTLTTIPIFRTDSLEIETKTGRMQRQLHEASGDIQFSMKLPILKEEGEFHTIEFLIPLWEKLKIPLQGNKDNYFILLKLTFERIKENARDDKYETSVEELKRDFEPKLSNAETLASMMLDYANNILAQIKDLKYRYGDGRLVKSLEDLVLAGILKNFFLYDYVVGNPPYVRVQTLAPESKKRYNEIYETVTGNYDIYIPFIERGLLWLNKSGRLGYINPNQFMIANYGQLLREFISKKYQIKQLLNFGDTQVFADATNYPCIPIIENSLPEKNNIKCVRVIQPMDNLLGDIQKHISDRFYATQGYILFEYPQEKLSRETWKLMPEIEKEVFEKIEKACEKRLGDIVSRIFQGLVTGADPIFFVRILSESKNTTRIKNMLNNEHEIEKKIIRPLLKGQDIRRYGVKWENLWIIYPYLLEKEKNKATLYSIEELKNQFPKTWQYFLHYEENLKCREGGKWKIRKDWYAYGRRQNIEMFERKKIMTQVLANKNSFTLDEEGIYYFVGGGNAGGYGIILKEGYNYHYILGLLNSNVLEFYLKNISTIFRGRFYSYGRRFIEKLPIKLPKNKKEQKIAKEITKKVDLILKQSKIRQKVENFPDPYFDELKDQIEEWDEITYRVKASYKSANPIIEGNKIVLGKKDSIEDIRINSKIKREYVLESLKGKKFSKDQEIKILLPRSDKDMETILKQHKEDKKRLEKIPISELEDEINDLVYELYGLDEEDRKVIEEFLERF
ncbi:MAG: hypothetical protein DRP84_09855 [Spirochaetes bacterium]|nr:MAG: hypothetical protein DRP84_09855 [Spirochaetota bacterium]